MSERIDFNNYQPPADLLYTDQHEWFRLDPDGKTGVMGVTDYAAHELGDVVYVQLPEVGTEVVQFIKVVSQLEVESVKAVSDIYPTISGRVLEMNQGLALHPEWVNEDPFGKAWMLRLTVEKPEELANLLKPQAYANLVRQLVEQPH